MNELIKQMRKQIKSSAGECVRDERSIPESRHHGAHKKEDRRREAIGFEIPVTRGAFDQGEGSTDDIKYHKSKNNTPFDGVAAQKHGRKKATDARFETMIGPISWVDSLFVWFPAAWMPLVVDALSEKILAQ